MIRFLQQTQIVVTGVLAALIGVVQARCAMPPHRHAPSRADQRFGQTLTQRPADDPAGENSLDASQIQPALVGWDVGDVGQPLVVGALGAEIARQYVRRPALSFISCVVTLKRCHPLGLWTHLAHQARHPVLASTLTIGMQLGMYPPIAIGLASRLMHLPDARRQR